MRSAHLALVDQSVETLSSPVLKTDKLRAFLSLTMLYAEADLAADGLRLSVQLAFGDPVQIILPRPDVGFALNITDILDKKKGISPG